MDRDSNVRELLGQFTPGRIIDLGTDDGYYARMFADLGWQVTATDARAHWWPEHPSITWT